MTNTPQAVPSTDVNFRFSGHETFPCRYTWLPKAVSKLHQNPKLFAKEKEDDAMVALGVGKNMVRAIRFWADAAGVAEALKPRRLWQCPRWAGIERRILCNTRASFRRHATRSTATPKTGSSTRELTEEVSGPWSQKTPTSWW
jgi:hypothetical protein